MTTVETLRLARQCLLDGSYDEALKLVRAYEKTESTQWLRHLNAGGLLIDLGSGLKDTGIVKEGIGKTEIALKDAPDEHIGRAEYNAGNGYLWLGQRQRGNSPGTKPLLGKALRLLSASLKKMPTPEARINYAGALMDQGRWVEASDELIDALSVELNHPFALSRLAGAYVDAYRYSQNHDGFLVVAITNYSEARRRSNDSHFVQNCNDHLDWIESLVGKRKFQALVRRNVPGKKSRTMFQKWVWDSRLSLNICPCCSNLTPDAYDSTVVQRFLQGPKRRPSVDDIYEVLNALHRTYASGRWCLAQGIGVAKIREKDQVVSYPSKVNSLHDMQTGMLITAIGEFYSVLDKVAAAMNSLFHLGHEPSKVHFNNVWRQKSEIRRGFPKKRSDIHDRLRGFSVPAMSALYRLAEALEFGGGLYQDLRIFRNCLEHRIVVPMSIVRTRPYYDSLDISLLSSYGFQLGRISRASIIYLGASIYHGEQKRLRRAIARGDLVTEGPGPSVHRQ